MILNDDECRTVYNDAMELPGRSAVSVTRAVEAAVIRKLAAGVSVEPETYLWEHNAGGMEPVLSRNSGPHPDYTITPYLTLDQFTTALAAARVQALKEAEEVAVNGLGLTTVSVASRIRALLGKEST